MGELNIHDLGFYKRTYGLDIFIETGTGRGNGLAHASRYDFTKLYSIEFMESLFRECQSKFTDSRIELLNSNSIEGLKSILNRIDPTGKVLFWLDAHFPGADFHLNDYNYLSSSRDLYLPLEYELKTIFAGKDASKDVFIIDDLRIYEDGPFECGNWDLRNTISNLNLNFLEGIVGNTHNIARDMRHQGFLILTPK